MKLTLLSILTLSLFAGCTPVEKGQVKVNINRKEKKINADISSISIVNNQLIISGANLSGVEKISLKNNTTSEDFAIETISNSQIVANTLNHVSLAAETLFDLILTSAEGASTYQVTFTLSDGSVTTSKIADGAVTGTKLGITASRGEFLKFNGTTWVAASAYDAQTYLGTWDASTLVLPTPIGSAGEYYIVSDDGTFGSPSVHYKPGDWIISDGISWHRIVYSSGVSSFNTRKGIVSLQPSDYSFLVDSGTHKVTGSKLVDIADINITSLADGQVLKWDSATSKWVNGTGGGGVPSITASAPLVYSSGTISISAATTTDAGTMSSADKTKLDSVPTFPTGDGLLERFSGTFLMRTCSPGQMLVFFSGTGWTCSTTLVMEGGSAQTIGMSRNPTSNTAGNNLLVEASGATSSATDKSGGSLILSGGTSTGTGSSAISFKTSTPSGSTGTTDNTPTTKMTISGEGNVGIGNTIPTASLDITAPAKASGRESLVKLSVSDAPRDFFSFSNGTTANTQFLPVLFGIKESDTRSALDIRGGTNATNDTGTNALISFTGVLYPDASADPISTVTFSKIATRPIIQFKNVDVPLVTMLPSGNLGVGTVTPKAVLHVDKVALTGTITSSGTTVTGVGTNFTAGLTVGDTIAVLGQARAVTAISTNTSLTVATAFSSDFVTATAYSRVGAVFSSGNVGIGTTVPTSPLQVYSTPLTGLDLTTNLNSNQSGVTINANYNLSGNGEGRITFNKTRGTMAAPLLTQSGDQIGQFIFAGFDGTTARNSAAIVAYTDENTSSTASGGALAFKTTTNGTVIATERMRITNSGYVGIGMTAPTTLFEVAGTAMAQTFSAVNATHDLAPRSTIWPGSILAVGPDSNPGYFKASAWSSSAVMGTILGGYRFGINGNDTAKIEGIATENFGTGNGTALKFSTTPNGSTAKIESMRIADNGNMGIGTSAPTAPLHVVTTNTTGSIAIFSAPSSMGCSISTTGTTCSSDIRLKENIETIDSLLQLDNILKIRSVHFSWKTDGQHKKQTGFIAQELEKIFPEFVVTDDKGFKQVNYAHFVSVLTSGVQNLYKKWFVHEREIASVKKEVIELKDKNNLLESKLEKVIEENKNMKSRMTEIEKLLRKK